MIRTKCVYEAPGEHDGLRVLVTRYWPRGVRKEKADRWFRGLGPDAELIRLWKAEGVTWQEFRRRYTEEFRKSPEKALLLDELKGMVRLSKGRPVTLLCTCRDERCHRTVLKEILQGRVKGL